MNSIASKDLHRIQNQQCVLKYTFTQKCLKCSQKWIDQRRGRDQNEMTHFSEAPLTCMRSILLILIHSHHQC